MDELFKSESNFLKGKDNSNMNLNKKSRDFEINELSEEELKFHTNLTLEFKNKTEPFEEKELYEIYDKLDVEENGYILVKRVLNFLNIFRSELNAEMIDPLIKSFEAEKTDTINRDEFVEKMKLSKAKQKIVESSSELKEVFELLDSDHDNYIGKDDIRLAMNLLGEDYFDEEQSKNLIQLISGSPEGIDFQTFTELFQYEN